MSKHAILERVSPIRFKAIEALRSAAKPDGGSALHEVAEEAKQTASAYGRAPAATHWRTFGEALDIAGLLIDWQGAVMGAAMDADRFLRAARARLKDIREHASDDPYCVRLLDILSAVENDPSSADIQALREKISSVPLPVAIYADPLPQRPEWAGNPETSTKERPADLAVAFVEFKINGTVAERLHYLRPCETHDLDIAVRVSRWPEGATSLILSPISIEPASTYELPVFAFERPAGEPPFLFQQRGRMILHVPHSLKARPFEFMYTAEFRPTTCEQPISIAGQRALRLNGSSDDQSITGYPGIDTKLIALRDRLRAEPLIAEQDLEALLRVLVPLGNLMGQAVQDALFPAVISERDFQERVRQFLRQHPTLGVNLEEQAHATGGRTDLSYRGIRIELKCEPKMNLLPDDCKRYASQPASYAVGTNRRVAVLCVLDCSPKKDIPFPVEDGLYVYPLDTGSSPVYIATCLIQGHLAKPSSLSRCRPGSFIRGAASSVEPRPI